MRVRIEKVHVCVVRKGNAGEFPDGGGKVDASTSSRLPTGARHVHPYCGRPKVFERLLEILNDFADWLGLRAHTASLCRVMDRPLRDFQVRNYRFLGRTSSARSTTRLLTTS